MMTRSDFEAAVAHDDARRKLCERLADAMRAGALRFRICFLPGQGTARGFQVHAFQNCLWSILDVFNVSHDVGVRLHNSMKRASAQESADVWDCRPMHDAEEPGFELAFHPRAVARALGGEVESFLNQCLFCCSADC